MLAALIATRHAAPPPPPPVIFYSNQLVAATTTFKCISITWAASNLVTSLPIQNALTYSIPGQISILDQLSIPYYRILNYLASDANQISMPPALYLSNQITAALAAAINLQTTLSAITSFVQLAIGQGNPPIDPTQLARLQQQTAGAIAVLKSLGRPL
jgi:hypothetical protein